MTKERLAQLHAAARSIEVDGIEAYQSVAERHGREIADVLLVAHLRRGAGAMEAFPTPADVVPKVDELLVREGIVHG